MKIDPARLPLGRYPVVHLCLRDTPSAPSDRLYAVEIMSGEGGEMVISLSSSAPLVVELQQRGRDLWVLRLPHGVSAHFSRLRRGIGNALWDAGAVQRRDVVRLVRALLERDFVVESVATEALVEGSP